MMSLGDPGHHPAKKRRFFSDGNGSALRDTTTQNPPVREHDEIPRGEVPAHGQDEKVAGRLTYWDEDDRARRSESQHANDDLVSGRQSSASHQVSTFSIDLFKSIVGSEVAPDVVDKVRVAAGNDLERAVNIYLDGSWKLPMTRTLAPPALAIRQQTLSLQGANTTIPVTCNVSSGESATAENTQQPKLLHTTPALRYIGAFGVGAWATRSGTGLLKHGEIVNIERARSQPASKRGRSGKLISNSKGDVLTRFTNRRGEEIGRLPRETAEWVSPLIDQKVCTFEGVCVYVPDRVRVNDTIYLQLRCYIRREAFLTRILSLEDDNRSMGVFEEKESTEEKILRLRQVALVKLFSEINLQPTSANEMTQKHKTDGLLRAAEIAEQYDKRKKDSDALSDEEETEELQDDQLDTLYKKAQSFDFNMPQAEPASTFALDLRKYQRQALHWMLAKERDMNVERGTSLHPLWEEYTWPLKDVDDNALTRVDGQDHFYVNPYSGELSLEFPAQEQHCLGGILADEMGLGKTIEMLSLIHSHRVHPTDQPLEESHSVNDLAHMPKLPSGVVRAPYTTLVVAPTSLLSQWESEAHKASQPGTMKTLMYYGADKAVDLRKLCAARNAASAPNVIITSYGVVLSELRQLATQSSGLTFGSHSGLFSVEFFRVILDEAHLIKNRRSKSARACYELKAIHRWVLTGTPIVNRLEDLFSLVRFLKVEPWSNFSFWKTFITVPFESKDYMRALNVVQTVLEPLVLRRTKTMKTPEGEPLVPLPPRNITIEEVELSTQEREIYEYIFTRAKRAFTENVEAGTLLKSFSTLFAQLLRLRQTCCHPILTRNKAIVADEEDVAAAADAANVLKDDMDLQELIDRFTAVTETASESRTPADSASQFTVHALRQIQNESSGECPICSEEPMLNPAVTACWHSACKQCLEDFIQHQNGKGESPRCFSCRAPINSKDIFEVVRHKTPNSSPGEDDIYGSTPPTASQPAPRISLRRINPLSPSAQTSAKIHALLKHLRRLPPNTKSVVFSQFTSFLDLIAPQLTKAGISHLRLDGTMPQKMRAEVLAQFTKIQDTYDEDLIDDEDADKDIGGSGPARNWGRSGNRDGQRTLNGFGSVSGSPQSPSVLLISLRAGGVGLNLTAASHVYMMDPWWSFAIEAQAIDRVHRMGQLRDVSVTRFIVKDSIEGRMLRVQERKMNIAGSLGLRVGGDGSEDERRKERIEELKLLFE